MEISCQTISGRIRTAPSTATSGRRFPTSIRSASRFDAAARMYRFAAADLLREVCAERFGSVEAAVVAGLALRYDGGSCFRSENYQTEVDHLGISRSPSVSLRAGDQRLR